MNDVYAQQKTFETKMFFEGLNNGSYIISQNEILVPYKGTENSNDPRFVGYKFGEYKLNDPHFCGVFNPLTNKELNQIFYICKTNGIQIENWDIYWEVQL